MNVGSRHTAISAGSHVQLLCLRCYIRWLLLALTCLRSHQIVNANSGKKIQRVYFATEKVSYTFFVLRCMNFASVHEIAFSIFAMNFSNFRHLTVVRLRGRTFIFRAFHTWNNIYHTSLNSKCGTFLKYNHRL